MKTALHFRLNLENHAFEHFLLINQCRFAFFIDQLYFKSIAICLHHKFKMLFSLFIQVDDSQNCQQQNQMSFIITPKTKYIRIFPSTGTRIIQNERKNLSWNRNKQQPSEFIKISFQFSIKFTSFFIDMSTKQTKWTEKYQSHVDGVY